jgi:hypothetical protein
MSKPGFSYDDLFPDRWLHSEDLQGKQLTLKITDAYVEDLRLPGGAVNPCGILSFAHTKREYVLNKTNAMVLRELWSDKSKDWIGHCITVAAVPDTSGKSANGLRILFVGTPEIKEAVEVKQPGGVKRFIRPTKKGADDSGVDPVTGEMPPPDSQTAPVALDGPEPSVDPSDARPVVDDDEDIPF